MRTPCIAAIALLVAVGFASQAEAQIKRPGAHPRYSFELEPHLFVQWGDEPYYSDEGLGVGIRASIPLMHNGPIKSINNSMAIGFGFDWAHFGDGCYLPAGFRGQPLISGYDCSANDFWLPVVWQWNFFFSDLISAFFEPGLAIEHERYNGSGICVAGVPCEDFSDTDIEFVIWLGMRFHFGDDIGLTPRLGHPALTLGPSFFL
jgi:hypothetical protein